MQEHMRNVAYSNEYLEDSKNIYCRIIDEACYKDEEWNELENGLRIHTKRYSYNSDGEDPGFPYDFMGSENFLYRNEEEIYRFSTVDNSGFYWTFTHQNGHQYFVFTKDLYGYSVLDLSDMRDYHFYPSGSFPTGETFIWCNIHYNSNNNILAVDGCYWACPSSVLLLNFSNPLQDNVQIDINEFMNPGYGQYDNIEFVGWENNDLVLKMNSQTEPVQKEERTVSSDEYMLWFAK